MTCTRTPARRAPSLHRPDQFGERRDGRTAEVAGRRRLLVEVGQLVSDVEEMVDDHLGLLFVTTWVVGHHHLILRDFLGEVPRVVQAVGIKAALLLLHLGPRFLLLVLGLVVHALERGRGKGQAARVHGRAGHRIDALDRSDTRCQQRNRPSKRKHRPRIDLQEDFAQSLLTRPHVSLSACKASWLHVVRN